VWGAAVVVRVRVRVRVLSLYTLACGECASSPPPPAAAPASCREFDADGNGTIEPGEFQDFLFALGEVMSVSQVDAIFKKIDVDGSGALDFDEFYK